MPSNLGLKAVLPGHGSRAAVARGSARQASTGTGGDVRQLPFDLGRSGAQQLQQPIAPRFVLFPPVVVTLAWLAAVFEERDAQAVKQGQHRQRVGGAHFEPAVFVAADIQDMMESIFDAPLATASVEQGQGRQRLSIAAGGQPHLRGFGFAFVGAFFVQAGYLLGPDQAQFGRLDRTVDQLTHFITVTILLLRSGRAFFLFLWVLREKRRLE